MASGIDDVVNQAGESRRNFLRKLIAGAAFAPPLLASFSLDGLSVTAADAGFPLFCSNQSGHFPPTDFSGTDYQDFFRDIFRDGEINAGLDVGDTGHTALNFTGGAGAAGGTWGTVLDSTKVGPIDNEGIIRLFADILIHPFNNSKGVGLLAMAFGLVGNKGLALLVSNAGNSDKLQLVTVDGDGKIVPLTVVSLGAGIKQDVWYKLGMVIGPIGLSGSRKVTGWVATHQDPSDPHSKVGAVVGELEFDGALIFTSCTGEVGIVARAVSAAVDSSVTNFEAAWIAHELE